MAGSGELLGFKCGRMTATAKGAKKFSVEADPRPGRLVLLRAGTEELHLQWRVRGGGNAVVEDLLVFPNNQEFKKVETGRAEDRVYLLQFKASSRRFFFWMQEASKEGDAELCKKLNDYMANPPAAGAAGAAGAMGAEHDPNALMQFLSQFQAASGEGGAAVGAGGRGAARQQLQMGDLSSVLQGLLPPATSSGAGSSGAGAGAATPASPSRGAATDSATAPAAAAAGASSSSSSPARRGAGTAASGDGAAAASSSSTAGASGEAKMDESKQGEGKDKKDGEGKDGGASGATSSGATSSGTTSSGTTGKALTAEDLQRAFAGVQTMMNRMQPTPPLEALFDSTEVQALLEDESARAELLRLLPEERQDVSELHHTVTSPQIKQAMHALSQALVSDNFNSVMANFGLDQADGAAQLQLGDPIGAFLAALQAKADRAKSKDKDKDSSKAEDEFYD